jgi:hypothetical protein
MIEESHKRSPLPGHLNRLFSDLGDDESAIAKIARKLSLSCAQPRDHPTRTRMSTGGTSDPRNTWS